MKKARVTLEYILSYQQWTEKDRSNIVIGITRNFSLIVKDEKDYYFHYGIYQGIPPRNTTEGLPIEEQKNEDKKYLEETIQQILSGKIRLVLLDRDPTKYPGQKKACEYVMIRNNC